jgi:hypothetical protein
VSDCPRIAQQDFKTRERDPMKPIFVYIAGPISKDPLLGTRSAVIEASALADAGLVPYVPHLCVLWEMISPRPYDEWISIGLAWLEKCDAVLRIPGESKGADSEVTLAKALGIPVFTDRDDLIRWAQKQCKCGAPATTSRGQCSGCEEKMLRDREQALFDKAKKVTWVEYDGEYLYCSCCDKYFADVDDLLDSHYGDADIPVWAWGCTKQVFGMDAENIVLNQLENLDWFEGATENLPNLIELQAALDKVAAEIPPSYFQDDSVVVFFEAEAEKAEKDRRCGE